MDATKTGDLLRSIERRTRFSSAVFRRDCLPVLEALASFVQMLPASEAHHHAQPGGLWIHVLEVADAALTMRAGMELPSGATTEVRKRLEHRWTYAVLIAALLHDVGKPVTDIKVTLYTEDPRAGRPWSPLAGPMESTGAHWYSVSFADSTQRDYQAHQKVAAMLLHQFVPARLLRWLSEDSGVLTQLLAYLAGEDPDGTLAGIVKRADSDSVRRNLLHGPRTRFSSARTRPLIERLMEALRRMLHEGGQLPLNRPGAAGWVFDGCLWFVCARLADEVRSYLSQHESLQGVPGKDRNDRLFDTWQEHGACKSAPDGGAVWRVRIECDAWRSPDTLTVLCFPLDRLYQRTDEFPAPMTGRILVETGAHTAAPTQAPSPAPASAPAVVSNGTPSSATLSAPSPAARASTKPPAHPAASTAIASAAPVAPKPTPVPVAALKPAAATAAVAEAPQALPAPRSSLAALPVAEPATAAVAEPSSCVAVALEATDTAIRDDVLPLAESASLVERVSEPVPLTPATAAVLGPPMRPHQPGGQPKPKKAPTPAAEAFMAWVAYAVGSGELKYNEEGALVHFVPQGCLLLSPEIFKRFLDVHRELADGPVVALLATHGDKAFTRLQNELAKSGWTQRNGNENLHYYAFTKADGGLSRVASFYLLTKPQLFWNPVPAANGRIKAVQRPRQLVIPKESKSS
ncbi:MobH family relaxase [Ideonella sp. YS5]|uniref:MobH family relaxase n=1 Tax=Ideonella sp. YS5 TaxID=3453714 RepID=UPI003F711016